MLVSRRPRGSVNHGWDRDDLPWLLGGLGAIALLLVLASFMLDASGLDVWTGVVVFIVLTGGSIPVFRWIARRDGDPWLAKVLLVSLLAHFAGSMARYYMIFVLYDGSGDAGRYHQAGSIFVERLREGEPIHPIDVMNGFPEETQRIADFVGAVYTVTGESVYAGFLVFAMICFWGQVLIVRAFRVAVPEGDQRRFTLLVLFLPSLVFWPASIGKEALMIGCLGLIVYGGGLLLAPHPKARGAAFFVIGTLLVLLIRPHVAIMSIGALGLAMAAGTLGGFHGGSASAVRGRAVRFLALVVLLILAGLASTRLAETFNEYGEAGGTQASLEQALDRTSRGGSEFTPTAITGPSRIPAGVVSVFFRPFPWEAGNLNGLIAAAEGLLLLGLFALSWRRLLSLPRLALRRPFLVFSLTYVLLFSIGFSFIANFGILARQRSQALAILLVVLALPKAPIPTLSYRRRPGSAPPAESPVELADHGIERADNGNEMSRRPKVHR